MDDYKQLTDEQIYAIQDINVDVFYVTLTAFRAIEQAAIENYLAQQSQAPDVPNSWREEFSRRVYANLAAADNQDIPLEDYPERILAVMDGMRIVPIPLAFESLKAAMHDDPSYAWSWHCNLAMPIMDAIGCTHRQANDAAARLMRHLFDFDVTKCREWEQIAAPTPPAPQDAQTGKDAEEYPVFDQAWIEAIAAAKGKEND